MYLAPMYLCSREQKADGGIAAIPYDEYQIKVDLKY